MKITVFNHITLDGVMQAPADPNEDTRDGFTKGGWAQAGQDQVMGDFIADHMANGNGGGLLLGRRTYEHFYAHWPSQPDHPFTKALEASEKYVGTRTKAELPWVNTTVLPGDAADAVATMKEHADGEPGHDLVILGSGVLCQSLVRRGLIDEFVLLTHPIVLGEGHRLFADDGGCAALELVDSLVTTTGVVIGTYRTKP